MDERGRDGIAALLLILDVTDVRVEVVVPFDETFVGVADEDVVATVTVVVEVDFGAVVALLVDGDADVELRADVVFRPCPQM